MRVDYTLPSLEPGKLPELPGAVETGVSFQDQLRGPVSEVPVSWQRELNLDARPPDATYLEPPPRPNTLEIRDAESERTRWRSMLAKHDKSAAANSSRDPNSQQSVRVMLDMLMDMQQTEDSIVSQNASVTRG
jgi:hypothetical protein